ncbi:MAG: hypothetical protein QOJ69_2366 [Actinomycetota bacterium]|jgi:hypothetical protein|nr:hypothetical protein [Actinomycetota bacterium]
MPDVEQCLTKGPAVELTHHGTDVRHGYLPSCQSYKLFPREATTNWAGRNP